jgi:hypothetical protein
MNQQQQIRERVRDVVGLDPVGAVASVAQKNYERWRSLQDEILRSLGTGRAREKDARDSKDKAE